MTSTITLLPILAALFIANTYKNIDTVTWHTKNPMQQVLVNNYWPNLNDLTLLKTGELEPKASNNVVVINKFLSDHNFQIQLNDLHDPLSFYVASILKIMLEWEQAGQTTTIHADQKEYPAVNFDKPGTQYHVYFTKPTATMPDPNQIIEVKTKNGDLVYMMIHHEKIPVTVHYMPKCSPGMGIPRMIYCQTFYKDRSPLSDFTLLDNIELWQKNICPEQQIYYDEVNFPMVDINQEVDIKWLETLEACKGNESIYYIAQALQQTKFQMNEKGAKVESAVAIGCRCTCCPVFKPKKILTIDKPFYLWIIRPGMKTPIFAAFIDKDSWKVPAL